MARTVGLIDSALAKGSAPEDLILYRGFGHPQRDPAYRPGDTIDQRSFMSTSLSESVARQFGARAGRNAVMLDTFVPEGSPVGFPDGLGVHDDELEVLLPRGSRVKILSVSTDEEGQTHLKGELVSDE